MSPTDLQNISHSAIPGLRYIPDFIDESSSNKLLAWIDAQTWSHDLKRRVQHYGYRYDYRRRTASDAEYLGPLPDWLTDLSQLLVGTGLFGQVPEQIIVNEYEPGQGIAPHVDCVPCFGPRIASLSLGSTTTMVLSHPATGEKHDLVLEPRSLLFFEGPARHAWRHGIPARKSDIIHGRRVKRERRVSLTFRTMASG